MKREEKLFTLAPRSASVSCITPWGSNSFPNAFWAYKELKVYHKVTVGEQIFSIHLRHCPPPALSLTNMHACCTMKTKSRSWELVCSLLKMPLKTGYPKSKKSICLFSEERLLARQKYLSVKLLCNHKIHVPLSLSCMFPSQYRYGHSIRRCRYEHVCQGEVWIQAED